MYQLRGCHEEVVIEEFVSRYSHYQRLEEDGNKLQKTHVSVEKVCCLYENLEVYANELQKSRIGTSHKCQTSHIYREDTAEQ